MADPANYPQDGLGPLTFATICSHNNRCSIFKRRFCKYLLKSLVNLLRENLILIKRISAFNYHFSPVIIIFLYVKVYIQYFYMFL